MLDSLRDFAKSWPGKIMGGFLLAGLAGFGINNVITDLGSNTVAHVGDAEITTRQFQRAFQNEMNAESQRMGTYLSAQDALNLGLPSRVLQGLAQGAALDQLASGFGLGVSEHKLSELLRQDPSFQNALGIFNPSSFSQVLQQSGLTEAEYFAGQSEIARRQQLVLSLFGDTKLPDAASDLINRYIADQRTIDYFVLAETNIEAPAAPTEADLAAYLTEHQSEFRTVETRHVQLLRLSTAELATTKTIDEAAIAAEYERTKANLTKPERRTIQQVVLTPEQVTLFEAGKAAGTSFDALVAEAGLTPTDLGTQAQADLTDANLAATAFGLADDGFAVIDGVSGKRAVHIAAIEAGGIPALADVHDEIEQSLAMTAARNDIAEVQDQIEELRAAFRPLPEIAERFGLDLYEADLTASGAELTVLPNLATEDAPRVIQAIFKAEPGALTPSISLAGNGNLWFDLNSIEPARDQTLDEVRDTLVNIVTTERINAALLATQAEAVAKLDAGETLDTVAQGYNVMVQFSVPFTRFGGQDVNVDNAVASAAFAGNASHHGSAVSQSGDYVVFQVTDLTVAEGGLDTADHNAIESEARDNIYGDFITAIRDDAGLRINQQALQQALELNTGL